MSELTEVQLTNSRKRVNSQRFLALIGILWLLLAGAIIVSQTSEPPSVNITWSTETEIGTAGFHILRSEEVEGDYETITANLINGLGNEISGADYAFTDQGVEAGATYFYRLQEVELNGNRPDPIDIGPGTAPRVEWWALVLATISVIAGTILLFTGLRREKSI